MKTAILALFIIASAHAGAAFRPGQYAAATEPTAEQKRACMADASRLCRKFFPDVAAVTACMEMKRDQVSAKCREAK
jgi:hypothetical protein